MFFRKIFKRPSRKYNEMINTPDHGAIAMAARFVSGDMVVKVTLHETSSTEYTLIVHELHKFKLVEECVYRKSSPKDYYNYTREYADAGWHAAYF